jgi:putative membrane protein
MIQSNKIKMKKIFLVGGLLASGFIFQACNSDSATDKKNSTDSAMSANDSTRKPADTAVAVTAEPVDKACADFAVNAANGGMMEVQLGMIARDKATSQRVKDFGSMMVMDHSKGNDDLMARAKSQNIALPGKMGDDEQKMVDKLSKKTGKDFDKAYMEMMVDDHKKDIAEFKDAAEKCTNTSIKNFASQTLPVLEKHLDSAQAITGKK